MSSLVPVIIGVGVALMVALVVVSTLSARRRRHDLQTFAAARGWTYAERDDSLPDRFQGRPFGTGRSRDAVNVVRGVVDDRPMVAFDYSYVTTGTTPGAGADPGGPHTTDNTTHAFSVVALDTGFAMPGLAVTPAGLWSRLARSLTGRGVDVGDAAFDHAFTVSCPDKSLALEVLHPAMRSLVLQWPDLAWRFEAGSVLAVRPGHQDPTGIDATVAALGAILDQVPDAVWRRLPEH